MHIKKVIKVVFGSGWLHFQLFFFFLALNVDFLREQYTHALFTGPTNITFQKLFH